MTKTTINPVVIPTEGYVVSQQTSRFVHVYRLLEAVYSDLYDAVEGLYGDRVAEDVLTKEFWDAYDSARSVILKYLSESVEETLSDLTNNNNQVRIEV